MRQFLGLRLPLSEMDGSLLLLTKSFAAPDCETVAAEREQA